MTREEADCVFCRIVGRQAPASLVFQDAQVVAFMDIFPSSPGHVLVVPARHAVTIWDLQEQEAAHLFAVAVRLARAIRDVLQPNGLNVLQSNGKAAGQEVFHFHLHLIPRYGGEDGFRFRLRGPETPVPARAELDAVAGRLRSALSASTAS